MSDTFLDLNGIQVYEVSAHGPELRTRQDAVDLMSAASERRAALIAIPVERLGDDFFELRTRVAGEITQKFDVRGASCDRRGHLSKDCGKQFAGGVCSGVEPRPRSLVCRRPANIGESAR